MRTQSVSAALYLTLCALTIIDALADWPPAVWAASALVVVFLVLEGVRIARLQALVGLVLAGAGLFIAASQNAFAETVLDGLRRTLPFLLLFASVTWLQIPAGESPALLKVRAVALAQPPGRRFAVVGTAAHFLGVAFNLAGLSLTSVELRDGQSFVLAGLIQNASSNIEEKVPYLGNIPVLGMFFKRVRTQRDMEELIIVATPRLVSAEDMPAPANLPGQEVADYEPSIADIIMDRNELDRRLAEHGLLP